MLILRLIKDTRANKEREKSQDETMTYIPFTSFKDFKLFTGKRLGDLVHVRDHLGIKYNGVLTGFFTDSNNHLISIHVSGHPIMVGSAPEQYEIFLDNKWVPFGRQVKKKHLAA